MTEKQQASFGSRHQTQKLEHQGREREYLVHLPMGAAGTDRLPAVIMCHGAGGTAKTAALATGLSEKADERHFVAIYPQAVPRDARRAVTFLRNPTFWNVGSGFGHAERLGIDDVGYLRNILDDSLSRFPIDRACVFIAGFSNGAGFALRAAVELSERFAAVAAVAGHLWSKAPPPRPLPMLYIIGDEDPIVPRLGGIVRSPWGKSHLLPPVIETVEAWARWLGWQNGVHESRPQPGMILTQYRGPHSNARVDYYRLASTGHVWPGGPALLVERIAGPASSTVDATDLVLNFFFETVVQRGPLD